MGIHHRAETVGGNRLILMSGVSTLEGLVRALRTQSTGRSDLYNPWRLGAWSGSTESRFRARISGGITILEMATAMNLSSFFKSAAVNLPDDEE